MNELKLGFIGLGNMGMPMARSLLKAGFPVTVFDLRPEALAEIRTQGAVIAGSPAEVAKSGEIIISMVRDESQTEDVLLEGAESGKVLERARLLSSPALSAPAFAAKYMPGPKNRKSM